MPEGPTQSGKVPDPAPATIEYGRAVLQQHWFYARDPSGIGPGSFIRLGSLPWQVVLVSEDDPKYLGIALDKPWPMKQEEPEASTVPTPRDYAQTLGPEYFATLTQSDTGFGAAPPSGMGGWGTFARVQVRAMRIGIEKADRCWDLSSVLSRLLDRFHANPKHKKTGYLADSEADTGVHWTDDLRTLLRCVSPPHNAHSIIGGTGIVYSSHFRHPNHPFDEKQIPQGWSGDLSLVGQIGCIAGVLADRLAELVRAARHDAAIVAIDRLVGRQNHPICWSEDEREDLARVRSELLRAGQWMSATIAELATNGTPHQPIRSVAMASVYEPNLDEHDEAASRAREFELGRRRLLEYQSRAQDLAHRNAMLARMIRESTEPFMDLVIRRANAEASHGNALGRWLKDGSPPEREPEGHDVPNPESIDPRELRQFPEGDFRTICLFRIGRLASTGQVKSILAKPRERGDPIDRILISTSWQRKGGLEGDDRPMLDPRHFPPELAKEMLEIVESLERVASPEISLGPKGAVPVVLWEGAEYSNRTVRLARTRSAYLESHGNVEAARKALGESGHPIRKSTFYDHLKALDSECPGWRDEILKSG